MDIGFGSPEISLQEVLPVQFLSVSYILWTTPELDWLMTWRALKKEDKSNSTVWSMSTNKLWHLMESLVFTEVSLFHVLVSLSTEDSTLVFTIQSSPLYQPPWKTTYLWISWSDGESQSELVLPHIQLTRSEEEWWWLQDKDKNTMDQSIAQEKSLPRRVSKHFSRALQPTF